MMRFLYHIGELNTLGLLTGVAFLIAGVGILYAYSIMSAMSAQ